MMVSDLVGLTDVEIEALTRSYLHYRTAHIRIAGVWGMRSLH